MSSVYLLDCTLRDGGYINDWNFGEDTIRGFCKKISQTGVDICEVGFIKSDSYDPNKSLFPDIDSFENIIKPKSKQMKYVGMLDMSNPVPIERLTEYNGKSIDGIRVIFKKDKIDLAYNYCKKIQKLGYFISINFVGTDSYTDKQFINGIKKFNYLHPFAMSIVDSFGLIKRRHFLRLAFLADNNMDDGIALGYHAHNNLQQAFGNAESLVEMNLQRDLVIDACVFGMGRGAGNLNLELFAEYMNENYGTHYKIEPMLEIMDEYLNEIYKNKFWGYSLPLYLSASTGCHPNYAIYLAEKDTLTVKSFNELLQDIPKDEKAVFSKDNAEKFYRQYQEKYIDDRKTIEELSVLLSGKRILILAPGRSLVLQKSIVMNAAEQSVVIAANFLASEFKPDYIFSSNMRRYSKIQNKTTAKCIVTSNMKECKRSDFIVNFSSYSMSNPDIIDNSVLMLLKLLLAVGVQEVSVAGMDGYSIGESSYYDAEWDYDFSREADKRNRLIAEELHKITKFMSINIITNTIYNI